MPATLATTSARILYDGIADHRFRNPEGIAVAADGRIWCGSSTGWVFRIEPDGSSAQAIATTGGFLLGIAFDRSDNLYVCDLLQATVLRLRSGGDAFEPFARPAEGRMRIPNVVVVDDEGGVVYVSDSHGEGPGPGIWRYDIESGEGGLWYAGDLDWANGMVLTPDRSAILVAESWGRRVTRIAVGPDGSAGPAEVFLTVGDDIVIDGLTLDADGNLLLLCYAPSRVYRHHPDGELELVIDDPDHSVLCHPTNGVLKDGMLYTANLGRWHITEIPWP
ncbi:MAG: gluconolactonase [Chloroflexota bacterium]|nr:gluconolactonase [Chloroflexota bacterium]